jgi:hypothetical protein
MSAITRYGYTKNLSMFSNNQILLLDAMITEGFALLKNEPKGHADLMGVLIGLAVDRLASFMNLFCRWAPKGEHPVPPFGKNGFPMIWDYAEANPFTDSSGSWLGAVNWIERVLRHCYQSKAGQGVVTSSPAQFQWLPTDTADLFFTDPPYYDSYPYADLSDFFYPILATTCRCISDVNSWFTDVLTPKDAELVLQPTRKTNGKPKDHAFYESGMEQALASGREVAKPTSLGVIVFANKTTGGWEALLNAIWKSGWVATGSWPIQTERESRSRSEARLQSSVHLVCRPRENADGSLLTDSVGDWRDILSELPTRIRDWLPRLAAEGIVGADAIFACLGPALEIFSRYSHVEKSNGASVPLREYLEHVWSAVSHEAVTMIFKDADAAGLEPDARLTAVWLWTLGTTSSDLNTDSPGEEETENETNDDEEGDEGNEVKPTGFVLEFDAARKIAQGLGIHLERIPSVVEVKGDKARLLPVAERTKYLFGKDAAEPTIAKKEPKKKVTQLSLFAALQEADAAQSVEKPELKAPQPGSTVLDQVHQAMILFAAGRGEALKRFLVEEGAGKDVRFWKLAQSLSALYPSGIDEKRWVDGVLARKKSLGL